MKPEKTEELISRYNDPDLSDPEKDRMNQALAADADLRHIHQQYNRLDQALEQLPDGLEGVDFSGFSRYVNAAIDSVEANQIRHVSIWRYLAPLAAAAALIIVALPLYNFLSDNAETSIDTVDFMSNVTLAPPKQLLGEPLVNQIEIIREPAGTMFPVLTEEGGVICSVGAPAKPIRANQSNVTLEKSIFGFIPDGSP
ncbi:MAG: hypothetical protein GY869_31475 [Planctomycetes bacterium]|nr:hypothetical protein [Planctomycetota bacterium]